MSTTQTTPQRDRKPGGRRKLPEQRRGHFITARVEPDLKQAIDRLADERGLPLFDILSPVLDQAAKGRVSFGRVQSWPTDSPKSVQVKLLVTEDYKAALAQCAASHNMDTSKLVRNAIIKTLQQGTRTG